MIPSCVPMIKFFQWLNSVLFSLITASLLPCSPSWPRSPGRAPTAGRPRRSSRCPSLLWSFPNTTTTASPRPCPYVSPTGLFLSYAYIRCFYPRFPSYISIVFFHRMSLLCVSIVCFHRMFPSYVSIVFLLYVSIVRFYHMFLSILSIYSVKLQVFCWLIT